MSLLSFDGEMAYFWEAERCARWSVARILFMLNRYLPIISFSLHVYWRVNHPVDNPVCSELYIPIVDTNSTLCACVIACDHSMLYLREAAKGPTLPESPAYSLSRPTTDATCSYDDQSQTTLLRKHHAPKLGQKPGASHELQSFGRSVSRVSLEVV